MDIERRIRAGEWGNRLPGFKTLAELIGVSVPTIGVAVARLAARDILVSQGPRRAFAIAPKLAQAASAAAKVRPRYLVIVSRLSLQEMDNWTRNFVIDLMRTLAREGWRCDLEEIRHATGRNFSRSLDCLRQKHPASHMLFLMGNAAISNWAAAHPEFCVGFLGGRSNHPEVRVMGVSLTTIYNHVLSTLARLGHGHILTALWDSAPHVADIISGIHAAHFKTTVEQLTPAGLLINAKTASPALRKEEFLRAFRKSKPTAVVVDGLFEYILVWTTLAELGLKVPGDVSIVNLMPDDQLHKLPLVSTHFKLDNKFMLRTIHSWIRGRPTDGVAMARRAISSWINGDTLAPAPKA